MYLKVQALVLRVTAYKDTDAILTILSRRHGKLTVKARSLRRKNSPLTAPCQLLSYGEFTLFENRGRYTINEASALQLFQGLRRNLELLSLGTYFAQVAEVVSQEDQPSPELLSLVLNCLYALDRLNLPASQVKAVFEMRIACLAGYTPDLSGCSQCGAPYPDRFDLAEGRLECAGCRSTESAGIRMPVSPSVLDCIRYICYCDEKRLFGFQAAPETLDTLSHITEGYLSTQLERGFSTLDFYKSLLIQPESYNLGESHV